MLKPPAAFGQLPPMPVLPHFMQAPQAQVPTPPTPDEPQFGRMSEDGIPFRGPPVALREREYELATRIGTEPVSKLFDTGDPEQNREYTELIVRLRRENGTVPVFSKSWHTRPDGTKTMLIYMTVEFPFRELDPSTPRGREILAKQGILAERKKHNRGHTY